MVKIVEIYQIYLNFSKFYSDNSYTYLIIDHFLKKRDVIAHVSYN